MKRTSVWPVIALCAVVAGCEESKKISPLGEPPSLPAGVVVKDEDIPVQADFEIQAEQDILPGNMEAELTKLENELSGAQPPTEGNLLQPGEGDSQGLPGTRARVTDTQSPTRPR